MKKSSLRGKIEGGSNRGGREGENWKGVRAGDGDVDGE